MQANARAAAKAVMTWLDSNQDPRGIKHWEETVAETGGLRSYGIGLTRLRKYAKSVGRDAGLAAALWRSECYEAKVIALLVDDPKAITKAQAETQVEQLNGGMLAHVFSSCDATLAKAPFVKELAGEWMKSADPVRRRCGYGLLYEISKSKTKSAPDEVWFLGWIAQIDATWKQEDTRVLMAMGGALMGVGKRTKALNAAALKVARAIGPIDFDDTGKCEPMDFAKHLVTDALTRKLGL